MKKSILIAAVVMAAVAVQASTVSWGSSDDILASDYSFGTAYFINADGVNLGSLVVQYDGDGAFVGIKGLDDSKILDQSDIDDGTVINGSTVVNESGTFAVLFVDTTDMKFGVAGPKSLDVVSGNNSDVKNINFGTGSEFTLSQSVEVIPEPCSVALLALGLAALGLKRKVA